MRVLGKIAQEPWMRMGDLGSSTSPLQEAQGLQGAPLLGPVTSSEKKMLTFLVCWGACEGSDWSVGQPVSPGCGPSPVANPARPKTTHSPVDLSILICHLSDWIR